MNTLTLEKHARLVELDGVKFAILPYSDFVAIKKDMEIRQREGSAVVTFPHEVVGLDIKYDNLVRAWRKHLGLSQAELAARAGITQSALSQMEKAGVSPQRATLAKLAAALGLRPEQLRLED